MIGIVDYGMGNLRSVHNALERLGFESEFVEAPGDADRYHRLILPGVGSFARAMKNLNDRGWSDGLRAFAKSGRPLLGICLGMQILFDHGEEHGNTAGLGLVPGRVVVMQPDPPYRVPHVGWNDLKYLYPNILFQGVKKHVDFYFVHSYHCLAENPETIVAVADHGGEFVACVAHHNIVGVQFHPEKSQPAGLKILENFSKWEGSQVC